MYFWRPDVSSISAYFRARRWKCGCSDAYLGMMEAARAQIAYRREIGGREVKERSIEVRKRCRWIMGVEGWSLVK